MVLFDNCIICSISELSAMKAGDYSEQIYRTSAGGANEVTCITCHIKNKNIIFKEKVFEEEDLTDDENNDDITWDEWKGAVRRLQDWNSYTGVNMSRDEGVHLYSIHDETRHENFDSKEIEYGINGQKMFNRCRKVRGTVSPTSRYLVTLCMDDNGIPPSLWLLDLSQDQLSSSNVKPTKSWIEHSRKITTQQETSQINSNLHHFGSQESVHESNKEESYEQHHPPLLLHSQTATRLACSQLFLLI